MHTELLELMNHFREISTPISDLKVIERSPLFDDRGLFARIWCSEELKAFGWNDPICQINYSVTKTRGTLRGLHFQTPPFSEMKLISCLRGEVFDVVVDLRKDSPTFLKWHSEILSPQKNRSLLVPKGFAHGFQTLSQDSELLYLHSAPYSPAHESGILADDPRLAIKWPTKIVDRSHRDETHSLISEDWKGLDL